MKNKNRPLVYLTCLILLFSCKSNNFQNPEKKKNTDPKRCILENVGESADFIQKKDLQDDRLVAAQGLANPQAIIWRDDNEKRTYYLARVMGTERKLYFLKPVADDETPGVASRFEGHFLKWSNLDPKRAALLSNALATNYNIKFDLKETYIIIEGEKPEGCP
jgi:hypothetical protein